MSKLKIESGRNTIDIEENALMDFQFALIDAMNERGITKAELAKNLGVTRARVSQLLSSEANPTVKLMARALALFDLKIDYVPKTRKQHGESAASWTDMFERTDVAGLACRLSVYNHHWQDTTVEHVANDEYFEREAA